MLHVCAYRNTERLVTIIENGKEVYSFVNTVNDYRNEEITKTQMMFEVAAGVCSLGRKANGDKVATICEIINGGKEVYLFVNTVNGYRNEEITKKQLASKVAALVGSLGGRYIGGMVDFATGGPIGGFVGAELGDWIGGAAAKAVSTRLMDWWTDELHH